MTITGGTVLDGKYDSFCVDTDHTISPGGFYTANVFSSYETLPGGLVEFPENLDLVNWILNQYFVGQPSSCGGNYTYGDVQRVIWALVEDKDGQSTSGLGPWLQCRADQIEAAARANGEGFTPECGDFIAVIFQPVDGSQITIAQVVLGLVGAPCVPKDETVWGSGTGFPGKNWAMYFIYTVQ